MQLNVISASVLLLLLLLASSEGARIPPFNHTLSDFVPNGGMESRIVGGYPIAIAYAKYQVSLRLKAREKHSYGSGFICGGSVITQRVVLTAAHCIYDNNVDPPKRRADNEFTVVMGTDKMYTKPSGTLQYDAQKIVVHQQYNSATLQNDIAMLLFNGYIPWNWGTVQAIALNTLPVPTNTECAVTGWGVMDNGKTSSVLNVAYVPIVSWDLCSVSYALKAGMLCAGYYKQGGVDACQGDSGGPLACNNVLSGVVSYGFGCGRKGFPGVYTNVSYFHNWILATNSSFNYTQYGGTATHAHSQFYMLLTCCISFLLAQKLHS